MQPGDVNLYLVGFMGTGKTTIGRSVAHRLGFGLLDSDHEIERKQGRTIPQIFASDGEAAFRSMEHDFIHGGHPATRTIVACGGGLVVQPGMAETLTHSHWMRRQQGMPWKSCDGLQVASSKPYQPGDVRSSKSDLWHLWQLWQLRKRKSRLET